MKFTFFLAGLLSLGATALVASTEYHVRLTGDDQADGKTTATAFRTIQKGISTLEAGDTLIIGPGQYSESVSRENLGNAEVDTVIKAEIPGTVLLHGDTPVSHFTKVDGYRFIYVADFPEKPYAVAEVDTLRLVENALYLEELEFVPGSYFYDEARKKLYLSSTDLQPATDHYYRAGVIPKTGLLLKSPVRVIIDGLAATGFNFNEILPATDGFGTRWGILLENPSYCTIRNCIAYLNGGGIALYGSEKAAGHNVIEDCRAYGNNSKFASEIGNIAVYHGFGDTLRRNYVYLGGSKGQWFYVSNKGKLHMEDCLGWGNASGDFWIKGMRETAELSTAKRIVSLNYIPAPHHRDSLIGKSPAPEEAAGNNSIYLAEESEADWNTEFADPAHLDFRLQSTSRFRKSGVEGRDRGPLPFTGTIYYVRPDGNDEADGQSLESAWKSLAHAAGKLQSGETLYVEGGRYSCNVSNLPDQVTILGRGKAPVILEGYWKLSQATNLSLKRLHFQKSLTIDQGKNVSLDNCTFLNDATCTIASADGVRILHSIFTKTLDLQKSRNIFIAGTIFGQSPGLTVSNLRDIIYSDYNSYPKAASAWLATGKAYALDDLKPLLQEIESIVAVPEISPTKENTLVNAGLFAGRGPWGTNIGIYFEGATRPLRVAGPFVHSTTNTTANLEWWTNTPAVVEIAWGTTPDCPNKKTLHFSSFGSYSLTGLTPGTKYYFRMRVVGTTPQYPLKDWLKIDKSSVFETAFTTTNTEEKPREFYVQPDGDNTRDGLSPKTAWRTLNHAANQVRPGDTVWMGGGEYHETLWLRVTGERDQPISFRGIPGQRATIDGKFRQLFAAVVSNGKHFQNFDAIYGVNLGEIGGVNGKSLAIERGGMFILSFSDHLSITRTLMDGRGPRYSPTLVVADSCDHLRVKNSVSINGYNGPYFYNSPNLRVENCVTFRSLICQFLLINHSDQPALIANNIFTDGLPVKIKAPIITLGRPKGLQLQNNCFFPREPGEEKTLITIYDDQSFEAEREVSLMGPNRDQDVVQAEMARLTFSQLENFFTSSRSFLANPEFAGLQNLPAKDAKGNPTYPPDRLDMKPVDFNTFFSTNPELIKRGVGLIPADFHDFNYDSNPTKSVNP